MRDRTLRSTPFAALGWAICAWFATSSHAATNQFRGVNWADKRDMEAHRHWMPPR